MDMHTVYIGDDKPFDLFKTEMQFSEGKVAPGLDLKELNAELRNMDLPPFPIEGISEIPRFGANYLEAARESIQAYLDSIVDY